MMGEADSPAISSFIIARWNNAGPIRLGLMDSSVIFAGAFRLAIDLGLAAERAFEGRNQIAHGDRLVVTEIESLAHGGVAPAAELKRALGR